MNAKCTTLQVSFHVALEESVELGKPKGLNSLRLTTVNVPPHLIGTADIEADPGDSHDNGPGTPLAKQKNRARFPASRPLMWLLSLMTVQVLTLPLIAKAILDCPCNHGQPSVPANQELLALLPLLPHLRPPCAEWLLQYLVMQGMTSIPPPLM